MSPKLRTMDFIVPALVLGGLALGGLGLALGAGGPQAQLAAQETDWQTVGLAGGPLAGASVMPVEKDQRTIGANQQVVLGGNIVLTSARGEDWSQRPGTGPLKNVLSSADGVIFVSGQSGENWRSLNYGRGWGKQVVRGDEPARFVAVSPAFVADGSAMAITTDDWRLFRLDKRTGLWTEVVLKLGERYPSGAAAYSPLFSTDETLFVGTDRGVYRSKDSGQTWVLVGSPDTGAPVFGPTGGPIEGQGIVVPDNFGDDPADRSDIDDPTIFAFNSTGVHRSDNAGESWRRLPLNQGPVRALAVSNAWPSDPVLLAAIGDPGTLGAVSLDGGATWKTVAGPAGIAGTGAAMAVDFGVPGFKVPPLPGLKGLVNLPIVAKNALDRETYEQPYLGTREMYLSTDGDGLRRSRDAGATWEADLPNATLFNVQPTCLSWLPGGTVILAGTGASGLYASIDGGQSWSWRNTALPRGAGQTVNQLAVSPDFERDRTLFAAANSGVWVSRDAGQSWARTGGPAPAAAIALSPAFARDRSLIAAGQISTDGGETWAPLPVVSGFPWSAAAFSPRYETDRTLWVGKATAPGETPVFTLYRSHDAGQTWSLIENNALKGRATTAIEAIAVAVDPIRVFLATDRELMLSQNDGTSWSRVQGVPAGVVWDIDSRVLSQPSTTGVIAVAGQAGISWSNNRGRDWSSSPRGITGALALSLSGDARALVGALPVATTRFEHVLGGP
jgi:photosystem II stability/assembly factor-like uncharacterized protein